MPLPRQQHKLHLLIQLHPPRTRPAQHLVRAHLLRPWVRLQHRLAPRLREVAVAARRRPALGRARGRRDARRRVVVVVRLRRRAPVSRPSASLGFAWAGIDAPVAGRLAAARFGVSLPRPDRVRPLVAERHPLLAARAPRARGLDAAAVWVFCDHGAPLCRCLPVLAPRRRGRAGPAFFLGAAAGVFRCRFEAGEAGAGGERAAAEDHGRHEIEVSCD